MRSAVYAALFWLAGAASAMAAELVMFETRACSWCAEWHRVIGPIYPKTTEGKLAPLRRVDLSAERPADLAAVGPVVYTPTFILFEDGVEFGRIEGYPGEDFFWGLLNQELAKLPKKTN